MGQPLAYFLTWTTRGSWLHGDERGSVDRQHNGWERARLHADQWRAAGEFGQLGRKAITLSPEAREIIRAVLVEVCAQRDWKLLAENVRTNHIHVVVAAAGYEPEQVMAQLKSWSTRRLRERGHVSGAQPIWTRHGSTRYIWNPDSLAEAMDYVINQQDNPRRFNREPPEPRA
ncbi:MAG: transposase [Phycisphaerales bacterium]|nr:transposase [Phycisphaerales bacterium]